MRLIGVTGTNGKTTSAYLMESVLTRWGKSVGIISTVHYAYDGKSEPASRTTPEAAELQTLFSGMRDSGCGYVVMEASSHSLDQHRLGGARFSAAVFTNLTGDHLDYHKDMENYYLAKLKLFSEYSTDETAKIVNTDDPYGRRLASELASAGRLLTYGKGSSCDYRITLAEPVPEGQAISILTPACETHKITTNLIGGYNAYNVTGAFAACVEIGMPASEAARLFSTPIRVPGRLEEVRAPNGAAFYVDYAPHRRRPATGPVRPARAETPRGFLWSSDAEATETARNVRAWDRRPRSWRNHIIVTSDNPRTEDPGAIIKEILAGVPDNVPPRCHPGPRRGHPKGRRDIQAWRHHPCGGQGARGLSGDHGEDASIRRPENPRGRDSRK